MTISEKIKGLREKKRWTVRQLAKKAGIRVSCIAKYESGEICPSNATIRKLASAFRVNVNELMAAKCLPLISAEKLRDDVEKNTQSAEKIYLPINSASENIKTDAVSQGFAEWLVILRGVDGLSIKELADAVGLAPKDISGFECGVKIPDISAFSKLSDYFNISADVLLGKSALSESDRRFSEFVYRIETLKRLNKSGHLPDDLYEICRNSVVDEFV